VTVVDLRWLRGAATVEAASLLVLLANLTTVHLPAVTSTAGPVHGFAWLATIATAYLVALPRRARLLSVVPGVGGLLAVRAARAAADPCDP
jgi:hypothetical protein